MYLLLLFSTFIRKYSFFKVSSIFQENAILSEYEPICEQKENSYAVDLIEQVEL